MANRSCYWSPFLDFVEIDQGGDSLTEPSGSLGDERSEVGQQVVGFANIGAMASFFWSTDFGFSIYGHPI
jgi:hypothetical protein